jgi:hypothetical protein
MTREALYLVWWLLVALYYGALLGLTVFVWRKGGPPERYGSLAYLFSAVASEAIELFAGWPALQGAELIFDTLVAVAFLVLAIRYNSLWLGAAMMVKGVQLAIHAAHLTDRQDAVVGGVNVYALGLLLISLVIPLTILGGTLSTMRQRRWSSSVGNAGSRPANRPDLHPVRAHAASS